MTTIEWDKAGERVYETGLDRGVLYLPDGSAVPWNGLKSVSESFGSEVTPVYYDGRKISVHASLGSFTASMTAITYPDEFLDLEGLASFRSNIFVENQRSKTFGLSYRTRVGNDLDGEEAGYKIHILYNVTAKPKNKAHTTVSDTLELTEFEWELSAIPEEVPNFAPTAHIIINTSDIEPWLVNIIEEKLYGSETEAPSLLPINELLLFIMYWTTAIIVDNGDETTTVISDNPELVAMIENELVDLAKLNIIFLDPEDLSVSDGYKSSYSLIKVVDNQNGTWTAETDADILFEEDTNGVFTIHHANAVYQDPDTYTLSDTVV